MDLTKVTISQIAAFVAALGTIVGAGFTIDARYAKRADIELVRTDLEDARREADISLDELHKQILENEQLKEELGNNATALKVLAARNKQELADIRSRLSREHTVYRMIRPPEAVVFMPAPAPPPPVQEEQVQESPPQEE